MNYMNILTNDYGLSRQSIIVTKLKMRVSIKEYYEIVKERYRILDKCQDLCVEIKGRDLRSLFVHQTSAYGFLSSLYGSRDSVPNVTLIKSCTRVIEFLESDDFTTEKKWDFVYHGGKKGLYFSALKTRNPEKYNYMAGFDRDLNTSLKIFIETVKQNVDIINLHIKNKSVVKEIHKQYLLTRESDALKSFKKSILIVSDEQIFSKTYNTILNIDKISNYIRNEVN